MKIELKEITVKSLFKGFADNAEQGVVAYDGKLDIRPPYQREYIYKDKQRDAVMAVLDIGDWLLRPFRSRRKHSTRTGSFLHRNLS